MHYMKRRICIFTICLMLAGTLTPRTLYASQVYGHLYFAELMLKPSAGHYLSLNDSTRNSYYLGSIAPDSAWIAHMVTNPTIHARLNEKYGISFPKKLRPVSSQLDDVHQFRSTDVSLRLITSAASEDNRAFAIGWLSHFIVDSHIHDLINQHGGFVTDPTQFDDPAMKLHDSLEALEMRHVLELRGEVLRNVAFDMRGAKPPGSFLLAALEKNYPRNVFYGNHPEYFLRTFHLGSSLMLESTRWYGYQSEHSPSEIARMKKLIRRFRPAEGKVLEVLTDLPSLQSYHQNLVKSDFISDWTIRSEEIRQSSRFLMDNCVAYYWWKDRHNTTGSEMSAAALARIEGEMRRINPADDLMLPRPVRLNLPSLLGAKIPAQQ